MTGAGPVGSMLASHMDIHKIAFTGSAPAGRAVMAAAAKSNLKHVSLELGGKSPALIFDDAELDNAVEFTSNGFLRNSGQVCFASSRVLVQENIAQQYIDKVKESFQNAAKKMGDPTSTETAFGPLADKKQFDRVMSFLQSARDEGVEVLVGGDRIGNKGAYVQPTVLLAKDTKAKVYTDEIFGPVITVKTFKDEEEAIQLANDTTYGLGCKCSSLLRLQSLLFKANGECSDDLHRRYCSCPPNRGQDRSRNRWYQLIIHDFASDSFRWLQAIRYWAREWTRGLESVFAS